MPDLSDVITGAIADAREEGTLEAAETTEIAPAEDSGDPVVETTGNEETTIIETEKPVENTTETPIEETEVVPEDKKKAAEDELAKELGLKPRIDGKVNRIPYPDVKRIVGNAEKRAIRSVIDTVAKTLGVKPETVTPDTLEATLSAVAGENTRLRDNKTGMDELEPIMERDPDRFVQMLAHINPGYRKFLAALETKSQEGVVVPPVASTRPGPDVEVDLGNGQKAQTYSVEGVDKILEWQMNGLKRRTEEAVDKRMKPLETAHQTANQLEQRQQQTVQQLAMIIGEARTWDGFKEHEEEIRVATREFPKLSVGRAIRAAYDKVVIGKLKTDRETMRTQLLAEMKKAPASTAVVSGTGAPRKDVIRDEDGMASDPIRAAIVRSVAQLKAARV